jgi:hypothetical protein
MSHTNTENPKLPRASGSERVFIAGTPEQLDDPIKRRRSQGKKAVEAAKLGLIRDLAFETLCIAGHYVDVAKKMLDVDDDAGAVYAINQFRHATNTACQCARDIRIYIGGAS